MIVGLLLLLLLRASINAADNACCAGINIITENGTCYNGAKIRLTYSDCDYRIMLEKDQYALAQNGSLIELAGFDEFISPDRHVTDYINTLQGVLIFMVLVLFRKKALRALAVNPTIGNKFPKSWQRLDDAEYSSDEEALSENK
ncbi:hypothetical protein MML48_2g00007393 [Holotrichia oblita]|uniref:Uncharacterized protein n=1 Tax=Holotrichia oblita TaxID=644536 RepID=A0ACB9TND6_HOLOL|nr:hypothetical protein MML48_2g00007393 [Holotrichia oblita]